MKNKDLKKMFLFIEQRRGYRLISLIKRLELGLPIIEEDLDVDGNLDFSESRLTNLPSGIKCGLMDLRMSQIEKIPENLTVNTLYVSESIKEIPVSLKVRNLIVRHNKNITKIPNIDVFILDAQGCANLEVIEFVSGHNVNLTDTRVSNLPDNFTISGTLYMTSTPISDIPKNLNVKGSLSIAHTPLSYFFLENYPAADSKGRHEIIRRVIKQEGGFVGGNIYG